MTDTITNFPLGYDIQVVSYNTQFGNSVYQINGNNSFKIE